MESGKLIEIDFIVKSENMFTFNEQQSRYALAGEVS